MWLYHVFSLSLRDVELILAERGVVVTPESIRLWCRKFGEPCVQALRFDLYERHPVHPGRTRIGAGKPVGVAEDIRLRSNAASATTPVDQNGVVLVILVQDRRNGAAAKRFFKRLLHGLKYKPSRLVTDGLRSYGVAHRAILPDVRHRTSRYLNHRAEIRIGRRDDESGRAKDSNRSARRRAFSPLTA